MTKKIMFVALLAVSGCAESVKTDQEAELRFAKAKQNTQMIAGGRTVYLQKGQGYPTVRLVDGRSVVILDRYTSNDPFLLFANLTQTSGSVLDAQGCTTEQYVTVGPNGVTIEQSTMVGRITPGVCFDLER
jgi:hypothetical protein